MTRRFASTLAALLLGSTAGVVESAGPAAAAACPAGSGVTVVVGSSVSCDANGGGPASNNFRDAGHTLTPVDRQPGFVCQVDGAPSDASCVNTPPADAYWGLFWSDGTSGSWVYASQGVGSLKVPAGGWVAFVFQRSATRTPPSVSPVAATPPTAKPSAKPTAKPTKSPTTRPSAKPTSRPTAGTTPGATPTPTPTPTATATPAPTASTPTPTKGAATSTTPAPTTTSAAPEPTATQDDVTPTASRADQADQKGNGSLGWVAGVLVLALLGGMATVIRRRKAAGGPS